MATSLDFDILEEELANQLNEPYCSIHFLEDIQRNFDNLFQYTKRLRAHLSVTNTTAGTKMTSGAISNGRHAVQAAAYDGDNIMSASDLEGARTPTNSDETHPSMLAPKPSLLGNDFAEHVSISTCHALGKLAASGKPIKLQEEDYRALTRHEERVLSSVQIPKMMSNENRWVGRGGSSSKLDAATRHALAVEIFVANSTLRTRHEWRRIASGTECLSSRWRGEAQGSFASQTACSNCIAKSRLCIQKQGNGDPTLMLLPGHVRRVNEKTIDQSFEILRFAEFVNVVDCSEGLPPSVSD